MFPGAEARPQVARAVEAYYRPGVSGSQRLSADVYETKAAFQEVAGFYAPRMDTGQWGWRRKTRALRQQTETLKFMRAQLLATQKEPPGRLPPVYQPLFGDPGLGQDEFSSKLDLLIKQNPQAEIEVAEGMRTVSDPSARSQIRVTVERPYIDLETMELVDKTRLVLVRVSEGKAR